MSNSSGLTFFSKNFAQRFGQDYSGIRIFVSGRKNNGFFGLFIRIFLSVVMLLRVAPVG